MNRRLEPWQALVWAAFVAPVVTIWLLVAMEYIAAWGSPLEFADILTTLFLGPIGSILFGSFGAAIFLLVPLEAARRSDAKRLVYLAAGALAGFVYSACGLWCSHLDQLSRRANSVLWDYVGIALGFPLFESYFVREHPWTVFVAAPTAGVLSGYVYFWAISSPKPRN